MLSFKRVCNEYRIKRAFNHVIKRSDFQGNPGIDFFNQCVKPKDALALSSLLLKNEKIKAKKNCREFLDVHDIGGADGVMMLALLKALNMSAKITLNEPKEERAVAYQKKTKTYSDFFKSVTATPHTVEDINFNIPSKRELILASHVLYYNRNSWMICLSLKDHLFTKIFQSLKTGGIFGVVLQSAALENRNSHEIWEDYIYPLLQDIKHSNNKYYTNAEEFESSISAYRKQFIYESGFSPDWEIRKRLVKSIVPIGHLNLQADKNGFFPQSKEFKAILRFYLKGVEYDSLEPDKQKKLITILSHHFSKKGFCEIVHCNKTYTIEIGPKMLDYLQEKTPSLSMPHM